MKDKKKGRAAMKQTRPKRKAEAKRQLNNKAVSSENQELLLKFDKDHTGITFDDDGAILVFIRWLEDNDYIIFDAKRMVRLRLELGK